MASLPVIILTVFTPFTALFFKPKTASKAMLLLMGAILCRGGRTVCATLKILGMQGEERFDKYHRVLSRASWSPLEGMSKMTGPLVIAIDEHIERRQGRKSRLLGATVMRLLLRRIIL